MAKRKKRNKKYSKKYSSNRKDYRVGGAVSPLSPPESRLRPEPDRQPGYTSPPDEKVVGNPIAKGTTVLDRGRNYGDVGNYGPGSFERIPPTQRIPAVTDGKVEANGRGGPGGRPTGTPSTPTPTGTNYDPNIMSGGEDDPNRQDRVVRTGEAAENIAMGEFDVGPAGTIPTPRSIGRRNTEVDLADPRYQMQGAYDARAGTVDTSGERVFTDDARTATMPDERGIREAGIERTREFTDRAQQTGARGVGPVATQTLTDERDFATARKLKGSTADTIEGVLSGGSEVGQVTGQGGTVSETADAELQTREAITGMAADDAMAAQIIGTVGYEASQRRTVRGQAATGAAANMIAETAQIPQPIAASIVENPAVVEAQIDTQPVEVQAAVAALPTEALVSSQMESLLGGLEDGEVPTWAKPVVDTVNARLADRGLTASTVARDALFNAIIQTSLPIAQQNAQALQSRAAQNLSNQQAANLQRATQEQQLRLQNLANRQSAESQTAQNAQAMSTLQSQFSQQAVMASAEREQQTALANLQNRQQAAVLNAQNQQAINVQNLGNEQQIEVANLQIEAQAAGADQAAENQARLAQMQVAADFLGKNAAFKQQMDIANLSNEQQMRLANLTAENQASGQNLNAAQQIELANLNKQLSVNLNNAKLAQQLGVAQLNVDQQRAMQNAQVVAGMDMAKFSAAQQTELANSKFMQTLTIQNMNAEQQSIMQEATALAQLDVANLGMRERLQVENAKNFLAYDMANLDARQQTVILNSQQRQQRMLSDQAAFNAAQQFNASSENQRDQFMMQLGSQMELANAATINNMKQFNLQNQNAAEARRVGNDLQAEIIEAQLATDVSKYNTEKDFARDQFNAQQQTAIAQSNVEWRRKANTADTAAFNAVNQQNAQNAFNLTASANNFLWQELRDEAQFDFTRWDNDQQRKASLLIAALGNENGVNDKDHWASNINGLATLLDGWLN